MKPLGQLMLRSNLGSGKDSTDCLNRLVCWELSGSPWLQNLLLAGKLLPQEKQSVCGFSFFLFFMLRLLALGIKMMPRRRPLQGVRWEPDTHTVNGSGEQEKKARSGPTETRKEETVLGTFSLSTTWMLEKITFWNDSQTCDHEDQPSLGGGAAIFTCTIVQF